MGKIDFRRYIQKANKRTSKEREMWLCLGLYSSSTVRTITSKITNSPTELSQIVANVLCKIANNEAEYKDLKPEKIYTVERAKK